MQSNPSTSGASSFRRGYIERDQIEEDRFEDDRRRRFGMAVALIPFGIAMALIVQYVNIIVAIDDADWQYVLHRPNFSHILKLSPAPILGGGAAMFGAGLVATAVAGREGRFLPLFMTAVIYAGLLPFFVGLLLPANLFLLDVTGLAFSQNTVGEAFSSWVWSTPFFVLTYAMTGMKHGFWAGVSAMFMATVVFRYMGPNSDRFRLGQTTAVTAIVSTTAVAVIMFGPLGIFKLLFDWFRAQ
ncbi:MAG TPA: hypothetical protein EYG09_00865 [Dehalococcoidia bacterium]|jgi:hypothetical protein|nr:hypothetical protein [Dehalococcoidia bacterium]